MGRKPSMFSKDYRRQLKLRRMKYIAIFVVLVIAISILGIFITNNEGIVAIRKNIFEKDKYEEDVNNQVEDNSNLETGSESEIINESKEESTYSTSEVVLLSGKKVTVEYEVSKGNQKINTVEGDSEVQCSLSPSQEQVLILDKVSQDMYLLNNKGELANITNPKYVSTNNEVFKKEDVLGYNPSYKWVENTQFIDDTHIAYSSALPWINENEDRYLWIFNAENNTHTGYFNIKGKSFNLGQITEKGLMISLDDKEIIVNKDGKMVQ